MHNKKGSSLEQDIGSIEKGAGVVGQLAVAQEVVGHTEAEAGPVSTVPRWSKRSSDPLEGVMGSVSVRGTSSNQRMRRGDMSKQ